MINSDFGVLSVASVKKAEGYDDISSISALQEYVT
jgi:hypothetical protein